MVVEWPEEGKERPIQRPVYYLSEVLTESKQRYPQYQKLVYTIFRVTRRLPHYFQEHSIKVIASAPLSDIIRNRDANGRVAKWAVEIGVHNIKYEPHKDIKSQSLTDFLVDWEEKQGWTLHFDGSKTYEGAGAGIVLTAPKETSSSTPCRSYLSPAPAMWPNTRHSSMACASPKK